MENQQPPQTNKPADKSNLRDNAAKNNPSDSKTAGKDKSGSCGC